MKKTNFGKVFDAELVKQQERQVRATVAPVAAELAKAEKNVEMARVSLRRVKKVLKNRKKALKRFRKSGNVSHLRKAFNIPG